MFVAVVFSSYQPILCELTAKNRKCCCKIIQMHWSSWHLNLPVKKLKTKKKKRKICKKLIYNLILHLTFVDAQKKKKRLNLFATIRWKKRQKEKYLLFSPSVTSVTPHYSCTFLLILLPLLLFLMLLFIEITYR